MAEITGGLPQGTLTLAEMARLLKVAPNTVRDWANRGLLRSSRVGDRGDRRFAVSEVRRFLKQQKGIETKSAPIAKADECTKCRGKLFPGDDGLECVNCGSLLYDG